MGQGVKEGTFLLCPEECLSCFNVTLFLWLVLEEKFASVTAVPSTPVGEIYQPHHGDPVSLQPLC